MIATSEFILKYITDNYPDVNKNKITLIYRGVSKAEFPFGYQPDKQWLDVGREHHPAIMDKFILTMPARVTRWKGHEDFLTILNHLKQQNIPIHGLVVGGPHRRKTAFLEELKERTRSIDLESEITFLGHRNDIKEIISVSDIVLSLAKEPEAFGRTALEALCLGIPVIAYNHGGAAEILAKMYPHGRVEPGNTTSTCDKIMLSYNHAVPVPDKNFFTLEKMLDETLSLYSKGTP